MRVCVIAGCTKGTGDRRWLCGMHNERLRRLGTTYIHREPTCSKCDRPRQARGLCSTHYKKLHRTGTFELLRRPCTPGGLTHREKHLLNRYGLSLQGYKELEAGQGGRCAVCNDPQESGSMFVDHDHGSGDIRALLCRSCNTLIGMVEQREDPDGALSGALAYCDAHCI